MFGEQRESWKSSGDMPAPGSPAGAGGTFPRHPPDQGALWRPKVVVRWVSPPPSLHGVVIDRYRCVALPGIARL